MGHESQFRSCPPFPDERWGSRGCWSRAAVISSRRSRRHLTPPRSSWRVHEPTQAQEVVRCPDEEGVQLRARDAAEARLAQAARGLRPPEDLLHPLPAALTHGKALVAQRAAIEPRGAPTGDRRHMGPDAPGAQRANESARMVALVGAERRRAYPLARLAREQRRRGG